MSITKKIIYFKYSSNQNYQVIILCSFNEACLNALLIINVIVQRVVQAIQRNKNEIIHDILVV